jgi:hypothetical protein
VLLRLGGVGQGGEHLPPGGRLVRRLADLGQATSPFYFPPTRRRPTGLPRAEDFHPAAFTLTPGRRFNRSGIPA